MWLNGKAQGIPEGRHDRLTLQSFIEKCLGVGLNNLSLLDKSLLG